VESPPASAVHYSVSDSGAIWPKYPIPAAQVSEPPKYGKDVLIIDDDPFFRSLMKVMLAQTGFVFAAIREAEESTTALSICNEHQVDLVFCDLNLPRQWSKNGIEIVHDIRQIRPKLPVYMVTADNNEEIIERVLLSGANGHILKPLNLRVLKRVLASTFLQNSP
jgi:CheY-like chemotaxis protein